MKRYQQGFTFTDVAVMLIVVFVFAFLAFGLINHHKTVRCRQLLTDLVSAKAQVATRENLQWKSPPITVDQLRGVGFSVTVNKEGRVVCPHGQVVDLGSASVEPYFSCSVGQTSPSAISCQTLLEKIREAKASAAAQEDLNWNDFIAVDRLREVGLSLTVNAEGAVVCPDGGIITLNSVGQPPTCSRHRN